IENEMTFSATSQSVNINPILSHLLLKRPKRATCGFRHPKCNKGCSSPGQYYGCECRQDLGSQYYAYRCKVPCNDGDYKYYDYTQIAEHHSANSKPNPTCTITDSGVTNSQKRQILRLHNEFRAKVARGDEQRSPDQYKQPRGSNIKELIWNDELAYIAQKWANRCSYGHESNGLERRSPCSRSYYYVGQNIYYITTAGNYWENAITGWYDEVKDTPSRLARKYEIGVTLEMIGHYTQMLWADTYEIGCGAVTYLEGYGSTTFYVCNYGPGGNTAGQEIYKRGEPASECGSSGRSNNYRDLCAPGP
ncbi:unnamed protein product, partial [Meganyctiphanes norvegica]